MRLKRVYQTMIETTAKMFLWYPGYENVNLSLANEHCFLYAFIFYSKTKTKFSSSVKCVRSIYFPRKITFEISEFIFGGLELDTEQQLLALEAWMICVFALPVLLSLQQYWRLHQQHRQVGQNYIKCPIFAEFFSTKPLAVRHFQGSIKKGFWSNSVLFLERNVWWNAPDVMSGSPLLCLHLMKAL